MRVMRMSTGNASFNCRLPLVVKEVGAVYVKEVALIMVATLLVPLVAVPERTLEKKGVPSERLCGVAVITVTVVPAWMYVPAIIPFTVFRLTI